MIRLAAATASLAMLVCAAFAQQNTLTLPGDAPPKNRVVYVGDTSVSIPADKLTAVPLHFVVAPGFHINSHKPRETELIATRLAVLEQPGVSVRSVDFPQGSDYEFSFDPGHKVSVYSGDLTITSHVQVSAGKHDLNVVLHYQACDQATCFPPRDLPVTLTVTAR